MGAGLHGQQYLCCFQSVLQLFSKTFGPCRGRWAESPVDGGPRPIEITVRRTDLIGDGFSALHSAGSAIKGRLMVTFINQHGALEAGIDHGGLVKEFLEEASTIFGILHPAKY